jgi:RNA polymerase sigma factor (sigma-70 family)
MQKPLGLSALLTQVRDGDEAAILAFMTAYTKRLRPFIRRVLRYRRIENLEPLDDVLNSVYATFIEKLRTTHASRVWKDIESIRYLCGIARHTIQFRARYHHAGCRDIRRVVEEPVERLDVLARSERPVSSFDGEVVDRFQAAMAGLPQRDRELLLRRHDGDSWQVLGNEWGVSDEAARKKYGRLLGRLRRDLGVSEPATAPAQPR